MSPKNILVAACAVALLPLGANAAIVYENPYRPSLDAEGSCAFNTTCALLTEGVIITAAQAFTIGASAEVKPASFTELDFGSIPSVATWSFYDDDGIGGAPGTLLATGQSNITDAAALGQISG